MGDDRALTHVRSGVAALLAPGPLGRVLWPVACLTLIASLLHTAGNYNGVDFLPVWHGIETFAAPGRSYSASGFVYPPSLCLLLAPLGLLGLPAAKVAFFVTGVASILGGTALSLAIFRVPLRSTAGALALLGLALFQPVGETLGNGNINGVIFALEAGALLAATRGRPGLAGVLFGVGVALKPVIAPLVLLFVIQRHWRAVAYAVLIPLGLSLVALAIDPSTSEFVTKAVPFLLRGESPELQPFNYSLLAAGHALGLPGVFIALVRVLVAAAGLTALYGRVRNARTAGEALDSPLFVAEAAGILLVTTFLAFSWTGAYYALYLIPLVASVMCAGAAMRTWIAWAGVYFVNSLGVWRSTALPHVLDTAGRLTPTWGEVLLLGALAAGVARRGQLRPRRAPRPARL